MDGPQDRLELTRRQLLGAAASTSAAGLSNLVVPGVLLLPPILTWPLTWDLSRPSSGSHLLSERGFHTTATVDPLRACSRPL